MNYERIIQGIFRSRPNRFIAYVDLDGTTEVCHVKNTGRCRELLIPGAIVYLQKAENPQRKTAYDLIAVKKSNRLINMDSQIPNAVFREWAENGGIKDLRLINGEQKFGNSRLDFYIETKDKRIFAEVKGVTLEKDGVAMFPDAPTERGIKHINELISCQNHGYEGWIVFIIQMLGAKYFTPNYKTHAEFGEALKLAKEKGVNILALQCNVTEASIIATNKIPVKL